MRKLGSKRVEAREAESRARLRKGGKSQEMEQAKQHTIRERAIKRMLTL